MEKHAVAEIIQTITNAVLKVYYQNFHLSGTQTEMVYKDQLPAQSDGHKKKNMHSKLVVKLPVAASQP